MRDDRGPVRREWDELARGAAGGFLFGIPLLYTMELWFTGLSLSMAHALILVALSLALAFVFALVIGFRDQERPRLVDVATEAVEAVGIALVVTVLVLAVLARIGPDQSLDAALGRIAIQLIPVTLGVAVANHLLPRGKSRAEGSDDREPISHLGPTALELFAAAAGALLLSLNIAPTDEIRVIAGELGELRLIVLVGFTLAVTYLVVFEAELGDQERRRSTAGVLQAPFTETVVAYFAALLVCAGVTSLLGAFPEDPAPGTVLSQVVVLGFPGALGAAAGRLTV